MPNDSHLHEPDIDEAFTKSKGHSPALRPKLESLGEILEHSLNEVYIFDCESLKFTYVNQSVLKNLQYSYDELMQMTPIEIKPSCTEESFRALLRPLIDGTKSHLLFEGFHCRKDRSTYIIEMRLQSISTAGKKRIVATGNDIGERKLSEKALVKNIKQLRETERISHFGGWKWDIKTNELQCSDEVYRIFGEEPQSFAGTYERFLSYLPQEEQTKVKAAFQKAQETGTKYEVEHEIVLKDKSRRQVREIGEFEYDREGKAVSMVGGLLDITDYTLLKEALNEQEEIYSRLFHNSIDGMMINDEEGRILDHNQAMLDILKLHSVDTFIDKQPFEFAPEYQPNGKLSADMQTEKLRKAALEGPQRFEWQICQSDGYLTWVEVSLTPITVSGKPRMHSIWRDISNRKLLQAELSDFNDELSAQVEYEIKKNQEQSQHMLHQSRLAQMGEMISMIAHQWRQPLASISAISGTLGIDVMMDEYKKDFFEDRLNTISELALHLSSTIDDFRGFFNEEKETTSVEWKHMVESSLAIIEPTFTDMHIAIHKDFSEDITVQTYQNEVRQVILNIISNAEDALSENGVPLPEICLKSYYDDTYSYLSIEDNAGGIPKDIAQKVFEPYFTTKTKKDGTGLGLYMSKRIIEEHCQGELKLKNGSKGAIFTIALPLEQKDKTS